MSKSEKQYWKYTFEKPEDLAMFFANDNTHAALNEAFANGQLKVVKKSNDLIDLENGELLFDNQSGRSKTFVRNIAQWGKPEVGCPDCNGNLHVNKKFFKIGSPHSPWFYICSNRDNGCKTVVPAKKSGELAYKPASAELRNARKITTEMFDRLWRDAPDIATWAGPADQMKDVINKGKARAYRFLAHKMIEKNMTKNINNMSIEELRIAYVICRDSDLTELLNY